MPTVIESIAEFAMDAPTLLIPLWEVLLFIVIISVAAILERHRLILVIGYVFGVYWVFVENLKLMAINKVSVIAALVFLIFGALGLFLTIYNALKSDD